MARSPTAVVFDGVEDALPWLTPGQRYCQTLEDEYAEVHVVYVATWDWDNDTEALCGITVTWFDAVSPKVAARHRPCLECARRAADDLG